MAPAGVAGGEVGGVEVGGCGCQTALLSVSMKNYSSLSKIQYTRKVCAESVCVSCVCEGVLSVCSGRVCCLRGSLVNFSG